MSKTKSTANDPTSGENDAWLPCPAGELQRVATELRTRDRRHQQFETAKNASIIASAVAAVVVAVGLTFGSNGNHGGLTCNQCYAQFEKFEQTLAGQPLLNDSEAEQMKTHLASCEKCTTVFEKQYPGVLEAAGLAAVLPSASEPQAAGMLVQRAVIASIF